MATQDKCCSIVPHYKVKDGKLDAFTALCEQVVDKTNEEEKCLYYGFSFDGDNVHCREKYEDAEGLLANLENGGALLQKSLTIANIIRLEVHDPNKELAKLKDPLSDLNPQFFELQYGFRR